VVKKKMEDEHKDLKRCGARSLKEKKSRTIDAIEKDQINEHPLGKDDLDEDLLEASEDIPRDEFTEEHEGKIAPTAKAGSSEIDREAVNENFAREHVVITDRKTVLKDILKDSKISKTDNPASDNEKAE
jgi:hypothetical protein